jgi:predicted metal-dependent hydrolase
MQNTILFSLIIIFIYIFLFLDKNNLIYIENKTGTKFMVQNGENKEQASELLGNITERMFQLKNHLYRNKAKYPEFEKYIDQLNTNLSEMNTLIYETDPKSDLTSYSVNKGQELSFCLKSKKTGQFHKLNLLMYVAIHEMAHIGCPETGHGELFKKIFKFLTEEAIKINLYSYESYGTQPVEYCGMILSSSIV